MEFRLLGPVEVGARGQVESVRGMLQRSLLAVLVFTSGTVSVSDLIAELWPEHPPAQARSALLAQVARLRRSLDRWEADGATRLVRNPPGYRLKAGKHELDAAVFQRLRVQERRTTDNDQAAALLRQALGLWRGPALCDIGDGPMGKVIIARLDQALQQTYAALIERDIALGRSGEIIEDIEELTARYPLHEVFYDQLMRVLVTIGRPAEAVEVYRRARNMLALDYGIRPSPALRHRLGDILALDLDE
ncbi:AfsR/SARP family transcriptional regulator [Longispora sp. NPDC051575]|uniref:AfsR/SARP family transcriptional regulator n=1 Tax=Longispora sp. NPDC051575 TaxID=3154943 RepID=UPI0034304FBE